MTAAEAIQILGLERSFPELLTAASHSSGTAVADNLVLPLQDARQREVAKEQFDRLLGVAVKLDNLFLVGKLSAAYRICVDPYWDAESTPPTEGSQNS